MTEDPQTDLPEDDDPQELSLDRLGEAYAQVVRQQAEQDGETAERRGQLVADKMADEDDAGDNEDESLLEEEEDLNDPSVDDDSPCPLSPETIVESILFVGTPRGDKLTSKSIASVMRDVSAKEVTAIAKKLNQRYEEEDAAYRIGLDSGSMKMVLAEDLTELQNEFFGRNRAATLSQGAIDVLAVVAYRQPIGRDEIEKARNKSVGSVLSQLVRRNLLTTIADENNARKKLYKTTDRFLELFQLADLEDLPQAHDFSDIDEFD